MVVSRNAADSVLDAAAVGGCKEKKEEAAMILVRPSPVDPRAMMYGPECSPAGNEGVRGEGSG
jgi:hypothetical protein